LTYVERKKQGVLVEHEERREKLLKEGWLPDGVERVSDWEGVLRWVEEYERHAG